MYSRLYTHGRSSWIKYLPILSRGTIVLRPSYPPGLQLFLQNHFAYRGLTLRLSHATAAEEEGKRRQDSELVPTVNRDHLASNTRYANSDVSLHDLGEDSRESGARERFSDQIASYLSVEPGLQKPQRLAYETNKHDRVFVNRLLRDKGDGLSSWRRALSALLRHTKIKKAKDGERYGNAPSNLVQIALSRIPDLRGRDECATPIRGVSSISRNYRSFRLARDITPPAEWSEASLAVYVHALDESQRTQSQVPFAKRDHGKGWTNIDEVVDAFDRIFYSRALEGFLSIEACNTALLFYYRHSMVRKARLLYVRMEDLKMPIPAETFNILLQGSASQKDLHNFNFLLDKMLQRGFEPNESTWVLLLRSNDSSRARAIVLQKMAEMKMLDSISIRRDVANFMIPYEIDSHLGNGNDHHSFLDHMTYKYGIGWMSTSAGNKILNEVAKRKSTAESLSLLYEMKRAQFEPDDISMNTLLRRCLHSKQHDLAIEILDIFNYLYGLRPGRKAYEALFLHAWHSLKLNFLVVVWRSACIYGCVSHLIYHHVLQSLLSYSEALYKQTPFKYEAEGGISYAADAGDTKRYAKFRRFAGSFAIGLDSSKEATLFQAMKSFQPDPYSRSWRWANFLIESSLRVSRTCHLQDDLAQLLRQALKMDEEWAAEGLFDKDDWPELLPPPIAVPISVQRRHLSSSRFVTERPRTARAARIITRGLRYRTTRSLPRRKPKRRAAIPVTFPARRTHRRTTTAAAISAPRTMGSRKSASYRYNLERALVIRPYKAILLCSLAGKWAWSSAERRRRLSTPTTASGPQR